MTASLLDHKIWPRIKEYMVLEEYDRDGGHEDPRIRIEFKSLPPALSSKCRDAIVSCVSCNEDINPLRQRKGSDPSSLYYACACPLIVNMRCSRTQAAADEYRRFRSNTPTRRQEELF